jgi:hypothetical protein
MTDHVQELPLSNPKTLTAEQQALQQLATELHRPPQSLAAFSHLSADQLAWLNARVGLICLREDALLREELNRAIPRFLRPFFLRRLRSSS